MSTDAKEQPGVARLKAPMLFGGVTVGLFTLLTFGRLVSSEMFLDGVTYAAIARNLASGRGGFWAPEYIGGRGAFHLHPALGLWLESLAFRVFGDHPSVERLWGIGCGAAVLWLVVRLYRQTKVAGAAEGPATWPALLLLAMPLASWCWVNNMLENLLTVFVLGAASLSLCAVTKEGWRLAVMATLAGVVAALGLWTKGPPALFVLAVPFAAPVILGRSASRRSNAAGAFMVLGLGVATTAMLVQGGNQASSFIAEYFEHQFRPSMQGKLETAARWQLMLVLARELFLPALAVVVLRQSGKAGAADESSSGAPQAWRRPAFFAVCGAAGWAPFLLFQKQMDWYLAPALPFFALALASLSERSAIAIARALEERRGLRQAAAVAAVLCALVGLAGASRFAGRLDVAIPIAIHDATVARTEFRDSDHAWRDFRRDVLDAGLVIPMGSRVLGAQEGDHWRLVAYLQRYYGASLVTEPPWGFAVVQLDPRCKFAVPPGCIQQNPRARRFALYSCPP